MPMMRYGWTRTRVKRIIEGAVCFEGGSVDGLSSMSKLFDGAHVGEEWLVNVTRCPPWAFGEIKEAKRVEAK